MANIIDLPTVAEREHEAWLSNLKSGDAVAIAADQENEQGKFKYYILTKVVSVDARGSITLHINVNAPIKDGRAKYDARTGYLTGDSHLDCRLVCITDEIVEQVGKQHLIGGIRVILSGLYSFISVNLETKKLETLYGVIKELDKEMQPEKYTQHILKTETQKEESNENNKTE